MAVQPSQQEEEALVREFFGGARNGFFVEVGANHPILRSQTYHLEQTGWTGVLIEPQPDLAAKLVQARKAAVRMKLDASGIQVQRLSIADFGYTFACPAGSPTGYSYKAADHALEFMLLRVRPMPASPRGGSTGPGRRRVTAPAATETCSEACRGSSTTSATES